MDGSAVVVRRPQDADEKVRVGSVVSREGSRLIVRWHDDGSVEENVRLDPRRNLMAVVGTLRHQAIIDPEAFAERFRREPVQVALDVLREKAEALTAVKIKEQLVMLGLEKEQVDKVWRSLQTKLSAHEHVKATNSQPRTYRWTGPEPQVSRDTPVVRVTEPPVRQESGSSEVRRPHEDHRQTEDERPRSDGSQAEIHTNYDRPRHQEGDGPRRSLLETLAALFGDENPQPLQRYLTAPLRTGVRFGKLDDAALGDLLAQASEEDRQMAPSLLLAVPRRLNVAGAEDSLFDLDRTVAEAILAAAARELREHPDPDARIRAAVAWLVRRVSTGKPLLTAAVADYIELAVHLAAVEAQKAELDTLEVAARFLSQLIHDTPRLPDPDQLQHIVRRLPFKPKGGRVMLMAAVGRRWPDTIAADKWWHGVDVRALSECAQGAFARILSLPEVVERVIRPLLAREMNEVTTRARLSLFLGLPRELAEHLPAAVIADVFKRVAERDPVASEWLDELSGRDRLKAMRHEVDQAKEEIQVATELAEVAEQRAQELAERCERLEESLQASHGRAVALRDAQKRQLQIDVVRALADLAAEVEELCAGNTAPEIIVERVRGLAASQDLEAIGAVGATVPFDPAVHEPLVGFPEAEVSVVVLRPGYRWFPGEANVLLNKALVEAP